MHSANYISQDNGAQHNMLHLADNISTTYHFCWLSKICGFINHIFKVWKLNFPPLDTSSSVFALPLITTVWSLSAEGWCLFPVVIVVVAWNKVPLFPLRSNINNWNVCTCVSYLLPLEKRQCSSVGQYEWSFFVFLFFIHFPSLPHTHTWTFILSLDAF